MLAARVLGELEGSGELYAVLDGARDRRVRGFVFDSRAASWCLYRGELPAALENAAPWLLKLVPGQRYTEEFFERGWNQSWGIVLASTIPSRELRRHLRRFLVVRSEEGTRLVFRYYDPRVLRVYLPTCTPQESEIFLGPIAAVAAAGEAPDSFHLFRRKDGALEHRQGRIEPAAPPGPGAGSQARKRP